MYDCYYHRIEEKNYLSFYQGQLLCFVQFALIELFLNIGDKIFKYGADFFW